MKILLIICSVFKKIGGTRNHHTFASFKVMTVSYTVWSDILNMNWDQQKAKLFEHKNSYSQRRDDYKNDYRRPFGNGYHPPKYRSPFNNHRIFDRNMIEDFVHARLSLFNQRNNNRRR